LTAAASEHLAALLRLPAHLGRLPCGASHFTGRYRSRLSARQIRPKPSGARSGKGGACRRDGRSNARPARLFAGITFGIVEDSFHARKVAVLEEANEVRAAYLRAEFVPEPHRMEVRRILREYVDERLEWASAVDSHAPLKSRALLDELWRRAGAAEKIDPNSNGISLFVESVNNVISLHEERVMLRERSRIPAPFAIVLLSMAILSFGGMGYHGGVAGTTRSPVMVIAALSFSLVIMLIADMNRPGQGWINVSQDAMLDLRLSLRASGR